MQKLLDRRPGESNPAYAAFLAYIELGVGRSVLAVGRRLAKSRSLVSRWCMRHDWVRRAAAYDDYIAKTAFEAEEAKLVKRAGVWAKRMEETREEAFQMAGLLVEKAQAMLKFPLSETTTADGKTVIRPGRWTFADAAKLADVAARLKQMATGLPTERLEHSGPDGAPMVSLATQVNVSAIQSRVAAAVEAQQRVDAFLEHGIMKVPGGDGGASLHDVPAKQLAPEEITDGDGSTNDGDS